jgi:RND family efflux transporter MFP subunit
MTFKTRHSIMTQRIPRLRHALGLAVAAGALAASAAAGAQSAPAATVTVSPAVQQTMASTVLASGTIVSLRDARLAGEVAGRLTWVAEIGDTIEKGAVVARIDDSMQRFQLSDAEATIRRLEASLSFQDRQLERQRSLASQNIAAKNQLDELQAQRDMTEQDLAQARIARGQILHTLERSRIRAPFAGRIVERMLEMGEYLGVGGEVVRLVDTGNVEVSAQAPMAVARHVTEGASVTVSDRDREAVSEVRAVIPVGDERSRMIEVRIALDDADWVIGSAVRVALPDGQPIQVVAVPRDALILRQNATYLFRVGEDSTVEQVTVTTGIGQGDLIEVRGSVSPGDRIVVRGGERLQSGQPVTLADETKPRQTAEELRLARDG